MKIIVASNNAHKIDEIKQILSEYEIYSMKEAGIDLDIEENGDSFIANALIKARAIHELTGEMTLADDSGLEVEALDWAPGIYSARYSGVSGLEQDKENRDKLLKEMTTIADDKRQARFCAAIAIIDKDGGEIVEKGYVYGSIGRKELGQKGFGYDSLFIVDGSGKTMAQMDEDEKNSISHRAIALMKIKEKIRV